MTALSKSAVKQLLGELPLTAELYWHLRQTGKPIEPGFSLHRLEARLPEWVSQAAESARKAAPGREVFIFATLRYWIEHTCLLGLALAGMGHRVTLAFLPYTHWKTALNRFDLRRQNAYAAGVLAGASAVLDVVSLLDAGRGTPPLPHDLSPVVEELATRDTQYTLQVESVDRTSDLYRLRLARDTEALQAGMAWLTGRRPDAVIVPNGSFLEFGAVFQAARHLDLPVVTYEFGEQRQRVWLAQNADVMLQDTDALWQSRADQPLSESQWAQVQSLFSARQGGGLWKNFARRWQDVPSHGGEAVRATLGLDGRPIALLATNVIGDSLTLGRQTFTANMSEWIERTVRFFAGQPGAQLVVRIHPGEQITSGPSVAELVRQALPSLPESVHLVPADAPVNTYDLLEIADLGLVYTTTVGLEMAMSGLPVIVSGRTHYRGKGFTRDPDSWEAYWALLEQACREPTQFRPSREQVQAAWAYAYRFFFEYPLPFPWQLLHMWDELETWPLSRVLSPEGEARFGETFRYLVGEPLDWRAHQPAEAT